MAQGKQWTRGKRATSWASLVLGVLLAVIVLLYLFLRTDFFAGAAGRLATNHLLRGMPFSISIEHLEGSIVRDVTLRNLRVMYRGGAVPSFELFRADEVTCRFSISALLGPDRRVDEIVIVDPILRLTADSTGAFVLPSVGVGKFATYAIGRFSIHDGTLQVRRGGRTSAVTSVNLDGSIRSGPEGVLVDLARGSMGEVSGRFGVRSLAGGVGYSRTEAGAPDGSGTARIALDTLAVVLDRSALVLRGTVVPSGALFDLAVAGDPVDIGEIARIAGSSGERQGSLKGAWTVQGTPERLRMRGTASGTAEGYALEDVAFDALLESDTLRVDNVDGFVNGTLVGGSGTVAFGPPLAAAFSLDVVRLDLSRGFIPGREIPASDLSGSVDLACRFDPFSASFSLDLGEGSIRAFPFADALIRGSYRSDTLRFSEIRLSHPEHEATASGFVSGANRLGFVFNVTAAASSPLFTYFPIEQYRADVDLNGRCEGSFSEYDLRMSGMAKHMGYRGTTVAEGAIKLAVEKRRDYRVQFDLEGAGFRWGPASFDSAGCSIEYVGGETTIKQLELSNRDASVLLSAGIREENGGTAIRIDECGVDFLGERWTASGALAIFVADSALRFEDIQFHSRAGAIAGGGVWRPESRSLEAAITADRFDLSVLSASSIAHPALAGRARLRAAVSGPIADPAVALDLAVADGAIDTFAIDELEIVASYAASRLRIDTLGVSSPSGGLALTGELAGIPLRRGGESLRDAARRATVRADAVCRRLRVAPLLALSGARAVVSGGTLDGAVSVTDSLLHPLVAFRGIVRDLDAGPVTMTEVQCDLRLTRSSLEGSGELVLSPVHRGSFRGALPLVPAPVFYRLDRTSPLELDVEIPEGDFADAMRLTDRIAEASGVFSARFGMTGTIDDPHMRGELILRRAGMRLAGFEERYSEVDATVTFDDTLVAIRRFAAREGKKGSVNAGGTVVIAGWKPKRYDLAVRLNDFLLQSVPDITAIVTGELRVGTVVDGGRALPRVLGACTIEQSEIYIDMGSFSAREEGRTLIVPSWLAEVDLKIPGNTWVRTDDARVELQGNVTLFRDRQGTYYRGEINLVRGWYIVYNNKFNIRSGKLQFTYAGSNRPVVDVEAETRDPEGRRIFLTIRWLQDDQEPRLSLAHEDAGYSETDIWMMLGGGVVGGGSAGTSWNAAGTAQNLAMNYIERALNSRMQGVTIELESPAGVSPDGGAMDLANTKIAVGRYFSQGLYVKYKQGLSISTAREIEVEYRLSDFILLRSQVIRYSDQALPGKSASATDEINLDVKLRWEF